MLVDHSLISAQQRLNNVIRLISAANQKMHGLAETKINSSKNVIKSDSAAVYFTTGKSNRLDVGFSLDDIYIGTATLSNENFICLS